MQGWGWGVEGVERGLEPGHLSPDLEPLSWSLEVQTSKR